MSESRKQGSKGRDESLPPRCGRTRPTKKRNRPPACPKPRPAAHKGVFSERKFLNIVTTDEFVALPSQDASNKSVYSYAIVNDGEEPAVVKLEIGPNGIDYATDMEGVVENESMGIVVPSRFLRYMRVAVKSQQPGKPTVLCIYFQAQNMK
ncbi:hypothetical protein A8990_10573 [Paenibacillus taihuensis]|uniref:DUF6385 domain-containing protein n=1 Tax=Paenibacillus taihuensis TaxID=1156355 RepID=A0A3D9SHN1_9BACL|nr:DUF6385 domain-containing protein [Paenibacillus taihuensis]REE91368.1 hypothetical protein A8990_10573 [Paenibacillus taihuensis]